MTKETVSMQRCQIHMLSSLPVLWAKRASNAKRAKSTDHLWEMSGTTLNMMLLSEMMNTMLPCEMMNVRKSWIEVPFSLRYHEHKQINKYYKEMFDINENVRRSQFPHRAKNENYSKYSLKIPEKRMFRNRC